MLLLLTMADFTIRPFPLSMWQYLSPRNILAMQGDFVIATKMFFLFFCEIENHHVHNIPATHSFEFGSTWISNNSLVG